VYAVGNGGAILHYDGGTWHTEVSDTIDNLNGVWIAADGKTIVAVGDGGVILRKIRDDLDLGGCFIAPSEVANGNSTLVAIPTFTEPSIIEVFYQWYRNALALPGATTKFLESSRFEPGYEMRVECTAYDGITSGQPHDAIIRLSPTAPGSVYTSAVPSGLWNMVSVPLQVGDHLNDDLGYLYEWDEVNKAYTGGSGALQPTSISPGEGQWGYVPASDPYAIGGKPLDATGTEVPASDFVISGLTNTPGPHAGFHMLGNPFNHPIYIQYMRAAPAGTGTYASFPAAAASGWVEDNWWGRYDNDAGQYKDFQSGSHNGDLFPWEAVWIHVLEDVDIEIPFSQPGPVSPALAYASDENWEVALHARAGILRDDYNAFGVHVDASAGWDHLDGSDPGTMNASHVILSFPGDDGNDFARDKRGPDDDLTWVAEVEAIETGPVTLSWSDIPATQLITLTDTVSGAVVSMNDEGAYTYTPETSDETREFIVSATEISSPKNNQAESSVSPEIFGGGCVTIPHSAPLLPAMVILLLGGLMLRRKVR